MYKTSIVKRLIKKEEPLLISDLWFLLGTKNSKLSIGIFTQNTNLRNIVQISGKTNTGFKI